MVKSAKTPNKARAASIARAERLQRQAAERCDAPKQQGARPDRTRTPKGDQLPASRHNRQRSEQRRNDRPRTSEREQIEKQRTARAASAQRLAYNTAADQRQEHERRAMIGRQLQDAQRRVQRFDAQRKAERRQVEQRKQEHRKKEVQQRRDQIRRDFAKAADRRQDHARRVSIQRHADQARANLQRAGIAAAERARAAQNRAAASIEQTHKRQRVDQQAAHRWQTAQIRNRHQGEIRSLRDAQSQALERHHHAVIVIDNREREALADFDARRSSLTGRIAEAVPGRRAANDEARAQLVRGFESERLHKHRDLEALKERQHSVAQAARLGQARERLDVARTHQGERIGLEHRQKAGRGAAVQQEAWTIQRVERQRTMEVGRAMQGPDRERVRPMPGFNRA